MRYERDCWRGKSMKRATYIYIFLHNVCKMQVFNLVFDSQIRQ